MSYVKVTATFSVSNTGIDNPYATDIKDVFSKKQSKKKKEKKSKISTIQIIRQLE